MRRRITNLLALFLLSVFIPTVALIANDKNKDLTNENENIALASNNLYLYGAVIESNTDQAKDNQQSNVLDKKRIRIINLGPIVNYSGVDYAPTISADGRTLYYVSNRPGSKKSKSGDFSHDFWAVKKNERLDTNFSKPFNIDTTTALGNLGVNTSLNEGAASIAADRQTLYFTGCDRADGIGGCDLYVTIIEGDKWGRPTNLGRKVNSDVWDSQPSISADGNILYFTSVRPGPNGDDNMDIWYTVKDPDTDEWGQAINLKEINTPGQEVSPFIGKDGVTLFFASDGHKPNLGGKDFYFTVYDPETKKWSAPVNLDAPINTPEDEQFITMPASADILYFSSTRKDLSGYQGNLDIFMAFVPSFYRTVIVKGIVIDECSGENIPAKITVRNPITGKEFKDSLSTSKTQFELIVSNQDYGNPKDSIKFVDLEVTAENPKYGKTMKAQRVVKPAKTIASEDAEKPVDEIMVTLKLGQRPVLGTQIDIAPYVANNKTSKPEIANFNGLVMEEVQTWDLYPLLNYVFFDLGSSEIPKRYIRFDSPNSEARQYFTDTTIAGATLDKYYHLLNIYGYRLTKNPNSKLEIVGCNDGTSPEEKKAGLSKERANNVYNYLKDIWGIDESRMKLTYKDKPNVVSNLKDSLGIVENRRVELITSEWEVAKPVFDKDPKTFPQPDKMKYTMKNGIEDELVVKRRIEIKHGDKIWKVLNNVGKMDPTVTWDWQDEDGYYPKDELPFTAQLIVTTGSGAECVSDIISTPVMQVSTEKKQVDRTADSTLERYSLILFPFDRSDAGPLNERIMRDYVYERVAPNSVVEVIGHTDVVGLYDHNQKLSERRSNTVENGIDKQTKGNYAKLSKRGVGEDEPLYDNSLPEGRFYNRTVQVIIRTPIDTNK